MDAVIVKTKTTSWLGRIDASRTQLIEAARSGNKIHAAFATADARADLIESLKDEEIRAKLLRMTAPEIGMVELANNPTEDDRIRVCAIAILSGFCPGDDQFAVFGSKGLPGKLYTKEAGFRTLFAHLGIVPEIAIGHPEFVPLGTTGKKIWRVGGKASCVYKGRDYQVEFTGAGALGLPGYDSDNVAGITAKARRQMLKQLWLMVSPILTHDHGDPDDDTVPPIDQPAGYLPPVSTIEGAATVAAKAEEITEYERNMRVFQMGHTASQKRIKDPHQLNRYNEYWSEITNAKNKNELRLLHSTLQNSEVAELGKNNVDELCRYIFCIQESVPEGAESNG